MHKSVWWGILREGDHWENPSLNGRKILKCIFETWIRGMDLINLAQDRDRWQAFVDAIMNFRVP
jgi:hypothetical protein